MGTRGLMIFRCDGEDKSTYCHFDSYPDGLGMKIVSWLRSITDMEAVKDQVRKLRIVGDDSSAPTSDDIATLHEATDMGVSRKSDQDWYCLTRKLQGDPKSMLKAGYGYGECGWAEYTYTIDLDAGEFIAAKRGGASCCWSIDSIPETWVEEFAPEEEY